MAKESKIKSLIANNTSSVLKWIIDKFEELEGKITSTSTAQCSCSESLTALDDRITNLNNNVTTINNSVASLEDNIKTINNSVTFFKDNVTSLEGSVKTTTDDLQNAKNYISSSLPYCLEFEKSADVDSHFTLRADTDTSLILDKYKTFTEIGIDDNENKCFTLSLVPGATIIFNEGTEDSDESLRDLGQTIRFQWEDPWNIQGNAKFKIIIRSGEVYQDSHNLYDFSNFLLSGTAGTNLNLIDTDGNRVDIADTDPTCPWCIRVFTYDALVNSLTFELIEPFT